MPLYREKTNEPFYLEKIKLNISVFYDKNSDGFSRQNGSFVFILKQSAQKQKY